MSAIAEAATVSLVLADYAANDSAGKLNIIGAGVDLVGYNPAAGLTAGFALAVTVTVPPAHYGDECSLEIILEDDSHHVVALPGPTSEPQKMRIGQNVRFEEPVFLGANIPRGVMPVRVRIVMGFATGLPLAVGRRYTWRVKIDHDTRDEWTYTFYVPGQPPAPVVG